MAATHTDESMSTTTKDQKILSGELPDPLHVPLLYLGACKITSDEVNLSCLISYYSLRMYSLRMYCPSLNLARVMQSGVSGMLLTYLHGSWAHQNHGETFPKPFFSMLPGVRWFRQAAACYLTLCWDTIKEGIYVIEHLNFS